MIEEKKDLFKDIIPSLTENSKYQMEECSNEKDIVPFVINKSLSSHIDIILLCNQMNISPFLDKKLQYDFLFHSVKKYKRRYQKWIKYNEPKYIDLVKEYYSCSAKKAEEYLSILTEDHLEYIKQKTNKGG